MADFVSFARNLGGIGRGLGDFARQENARRAKIADEISLLEAQERIRAQAQIPFFQQQAELQRQLQDAEFEAQRRRQAATFSALPGLVQQSFGGQVQGQDNVAGQGPVGLQPQGRRSFSPFVSKPAFSINPEGELSTTITQAENPVYGMAKDLRDEFRRSSTFKDFQEISRAAKNIEAAYRRSVDTNTVDKIAVDQALVVSFNKLLDPGSVVRESEFARTPRGQAMIRAAQGRIQQLTKGGVGLTQEGREEIFNMAQDLLSAGGQSISSEMDVFGNLADEFGVPQEYVFGSFREEFGIPKESKSSSGRTSSGRTSSGRTSSGVGYKVIHKE